MSRLPDLRFRCLLRLLAMVLGITIYGMQTAVEAQTFTTRKYSGMPALRVSVSPAPTQNAVAVSQVEITVNSVPAKSVCNVDRELEVVYYMGSPYDSSMAHHAKVAIPAGEYSASATILPIRRDDFCSWTVDVFENGRRIQQGQSVVSSVQSQRSTSQLLQFSKSQFAESMTVYSEKATNPTFPGQIQNPASPVTKRDAAAAFEDWRAYASYDAVFIPTSETSNLSAKAREALSQYASAGGTLVVHGEPKVDTLTIDRAFKMSDVSTETNSRWKEILEGSERFGLRRSHGGGQIILDVVDEDGVQNLTSDVFKRLLTESRHYPFSTIFIDDDVDYEWFWKNLVQSVGTTPIIFFGVITLLILFIVGPVMIFIARRLRRPTLLLFLIPVFSVLMSLFVLIANVILGGSGTTGRVASLQYYDSDSRQGFVWSRQSYSSGMPPWAGLEFSDRALLSPVRTDGSSSNQLDVRSNVQGHLYSLEGKQVLKHWLLPRAQQQLVVAHPIENYAMPIRVESTSVSSAKITNISKNPLELVVVKDAAQKLFVAENLKAGDSIDVPATYVDQLAGQAILWNSTFAPEAPKDVDTTKRLSTRVRFMGGMGILSHPDMLAPILNARMGLSQLEDYGYLIVSRHELTAETPFPKEDFAKEKNLHVITGVNRW